MPSSSRHARQCCDLHRRARQSVKWSQVHQQSFTEAAMYLAHRTLIRVGTLVALLLGASTVHAEWPETAIKWIVPFSPGGANDLIARAAAKGVSERLGKPIVIENKPGAGAVIGAQYV